MHGLRSKPDEGGSSPAGQLDCQLLVCIAGQLVQRAQDVGAPGQQGPPVRQGVDAAQREVQAVTCGGGREGQRAIVTRGAGRVLAWGRVWRQEELKWL